MAANLFMPTGETDRQSCPAGMVKGASQ